MNNVSLPHPNNFLVVESLNYPNPYDFNIPHRHDYFEIILILEGGGEQLIDFTKTGLQPNSIYTVYPGQIHLLKREKAEGLILQFRKDIFDFIFPIQYHYLYFPQAGLQLDEDTFRHLYGIAENIRLLNTQQQLSPLSIYKSYSYLQIVLITLIELHEQNTPKSEGSFGGKFLQLLSQHIREKRKVADYAEIMNLTTDRLTTLCKETFGTTPLRLIHESLLLEIKRQMVSGNLNLKEIAFELNFDSTANFSSFVKSATSFTPSELQEQLKKNRYS
ncbi:DNA-binding transcriptional regulator ChbR [compost metagenome]